MIDFSFSPDGRQLATVSISGVVTIRDAEGLQPTGPPILGSQSAVEGFSFGPHFSDDGRWLVHDSDGSTRLIDLASRTVVGGALPRSGSGLGQVASNARWAVTTYEGGVYRWNLAVDSWFELACRAVGRNMTEDEWRQFGPADEPPAQTCEQWPATTADE